MVDNYNLIFLIYSVFGLFMLLFSKQVSAFFYNTVLIYTHKTRLKHTYLFKVNDANEKLMYSLARTIFVVYFLVLVLMSLYYLIYVNHFDFSSILK